jgi:hypothetical protein
MTTFAAFKKQALKNPKIRAEYERLAPEFALAGERIKASAVGKDLKVTLA